MKKLSEEQYEILHPYMPVQRGNVRISNLDVINAVLYVARNGCKWRALPKIFGNWHTIYTSTSVKVHPDGTGALKIRSTVDWQISWRLEHQDLSGCRG